MSSYYVGSRAQFYNVRWHSFTERTLAETVAMIDMVRLRNVSSRQGHPPRVLDVACGTGVLLHMLTKHIPDMEGYGLDASADMLAKARLALADQPHIRLEQAILVNGEASHLPYASQFFDLITCTNALHDISDSVGTLTQLRQLLAPEGQLILEDYARHGPPVLWTLFEWLIRRIEAGEVQAYSLSEVKSLCRQAGLSVARERAFALNWLWHGWALRLSVASNTMLQDSEDEEKR